MSRGVMNFFYFFVLFTLFIACSQGQTDLNAEILQKNGSETFSFDEGAQSEKIISTQRDERGVPLQPKTSLNKTESTAEETLAKNLDKVTNHKHQGDEAEDKLDSKKRNKHAPMTGKKTSTEAPLQVGESLIGKTAPHSNFSNPKSHRGNKLRDDPPADDAAPPADGAEAPADDAAPPADGAEGEGEGEPGADGAKPTKKPGKGSSNMFKPSIYLILSLILLPLNFVKF